MVSLAAENVSISLGGRRALDDVSAVLGPGLTGIVGPNGAGKSTLARVLAGLIAPDTGCVRFDGGPLATLRPAERARTIAYLPQSDALAWPLEVRRLVALGRLPGLAPLARLGAADEAAVDCALAKVGGTVLAGRRVDQLSGGERARVLLARALATEAPALIADEPLAALDPAHRLDVMAVLARLAGTGTTVLVVLHDLTLAARFCDRLLVLDTARLVADGSPAAVLTDALLARVWGVRVHRGGDGLLVPVARA